MYFVLQLTVSNLPKKILAWDRGSHMDTLPLLTMQAFLESIVRNRPR